MKRRKRFTRRIKRRSPKMVYKIGDTVSVTVVLRNGHLHLSIQAPGDMAIREIRLQSGPAC